MGRHSKAISVPRIIMDAATELAKGDINRIRINPDGTVTVLNHPKH